MFCNYSFYSKNSVLRRPTQWQLPDSFFLLQNFVISVLEVTKFIFEKLKIFCCPPKVTKFFCNKQNPIRQLDLTPNRLRSSLTRFFFFQLSKTISKKSPKNYEKISKKILSSRYTSEL
jgi:hypothetical protein